MTKTSQTVLPAKIYAEAIVRSKTGDSLLRSNALVSSDDLDQFQADPKVLGDAVERFVKAGFEVFTVGKAVISIAAAPEVYEEAFQTKFETEERIVIKSLGVKEPATFINAKDNKPFGEIDVSRTSWSDILAGVAIGEPSYYFGSRIPAALPPAIAAKALSVIKDAAFNVANELNATALHREGIKGKGIKIAMIDTGWYPHPFFYENGYAVTPILTPGTDELFRDDHGHGTGESANILAIAPEVELFMVKTGIVVDGKHKNVSPVSAFLTAIKLEPSIITCSWGSDQRDADLSPANRLLSGVIARAVSKGIIVIFSAGNGHWGFPGQHPDVISVGGVYKDLENAGKLEASNYASSFQSPVYAGRSVPDVCGLVGQRPYADYIMLPVASNSEMDQVMAKANDGTTDVDGWARFSGTSAAAPQIAGVCALILQAAKQVGKNLTSVQVRKILQDTAIDVVAGSSNSASGGASAGVGRDLATGHGLVDAAAAVNKARELDTGQCCDSCEAQSQSFSSSPITSSNTQNNQRRKPMSNEFPKLKTKVDEIQSRLDEVLRTDFIDKDLVENVELQISVDNFVERSAQTDAILALVNSLKELKLPSKNSPKTPVPTSETAAAKKAREDAEQAKIDAIKKKHVFAAKSLLKVQKHKELATQVLITAMNCTDEEIVEKAIEALGEFGYNPHPSEEEDVSSFATKIGSYWRANGKCYNSESDADRDQNGFTCPS
ncbi:MAG: S8 family serine peptidase [Pseudanabaenaceae cyanobacterium bins.39]|nr:S8 family serine peptidase [Pseudanabaenaceae cyanobacterium bins.39]